MYLTVKDIYFTTLKTRVTQPVLNVQLMNFEL